jgi:putative membrane protein
MNFLIPSNTTSKISVFIIWLFHLCGMVGISYGNKEFFLAFTPINLFISFVLLFVNQKQLESKELKSAFLIFFIGMISEILGVNYGLIFGDYVYLDNLGVKILGVPVLIGVNWIILTFITGSLSSFIFKNKYVSILMGAILMIGLDLLIEPVAPLLGFWIFDLQKVPLQNYIGMVCNRNNNSSSFSI